METIANTLIFILGWTVAIAAPTALYLFLVPDGKRGMSITNLLLWVIRLPLTLLLGILFIVMICTIATGVGFIAGVIGFALYTMLIYEPFCKFHDRRRGRDREHILDRGLNNDAVQHLNNSAPCANPHCLFCQMPQGHRDPYYDDPGNLTHGHSEGQTSLYERQVIARRTYAH